MNFTKQSILRRFLFLLYRFLCKFFDATLLNIPKINIKNVIL